MKYDIVKNNVLVMRFFDDNVFEEAMEEKQLKGMEDDSRGEPLITDTSENIAAFIESRHSKGLYDEATAFMRASPNKNSPLGKEVEALLKSLNDDEAPQSGTREEVIPPEAEEEEKTDTEGIEEKKKPGRS